MNKIKIKMSISAQEKNTLNIKGMLTGYVKEIVQFDNTKYQAHY